MSLLLLLTTVAFAQTPVKWYQKALDLDSNEKIEIKNTVVAILDTGIDKNHPALKSTLWTNTGETGLDKSGRDKATNGIDDDKNGFVDDVHGWNFAGNNSNLKDEHGHGTHIAGLIAGDSAQFSGIAPGTKIMILKYFDPFNE